jgi:hypothetical protein
MTCETFRAELLHAQQVSGSPLRGTKGKAPAFGHKPSSPQRALAKISNPRRSEFRDPHGDFS